MLKRASSLIELVFAVMIMGMAVSALPIATKVAMKSQDTTALKDYINIAVFANSVFSKLPLSKENLCVSDFRKNTPLAQYCAFHSKSVPNMQYCLNTSKDGGIPCKNSIYRSDFDIGAGRQDVIDAEVDRFAARGVMFVNFNISSDAQARPLPPFWGASPAALNAKRVFQTATDYFNGTESKIVLSDLSDNIRADAMMDISECQNTQKGANANWGAYSDAKDFDLISRPLTHPVACKIVINLSKDAKAAKALGVNPKDARLFFLAHYGDMGRTQALYTQYTLRYNAPNATTDTAAQAMLDENIEKILKNQVI